MNQGHSGVNEVIQEKQSKHCLVSVGRGSFYPGTGMAAFQINYSKYFPIHVFFVGLSDGTDEILKERKFKKAHKLSYTLLHPPVIPLSSVRNLLE